MKRAFTYALSLALLLSLTACNKPQAEQPGSGQPDPASQADVSVPEPDSTPDPEPPVTQAAEQLSDAVPPAPAENEDPQDQTDAIIAEPVNQEPAEPEPVSEPIQTEPPKSAEQEQQQPQIQQPPVEQQPAEQEPEQSPVKQTEGMNALEEALEKGRQLAEERRKEFEEQRQQSSEIGVSLEEILAANPGAYVDENGSLHLPHLKDYEHVKLQ